MSYPNAVRSLMPTVVVIAALVGCQDRNAAKSSSVDANPQVEGAESGDVDRKSAKPARDKRRAVAGNAKDALFAQLSGRLMSAMQSDGPAAAIEVCSKEAITIADAVGKEHGVRIGRTSFKLRNPANAPSDWVEPFIEKRSETPEYVQLDDGALGALFPIRISVKCLMCHGQPDDILDAVKPQLKKLYPEDSATGFKLDDLRGWFWVEVPAE